MCGIAGFCKRPTSWSEQESHNLSRMVDSLHHRGPDGRGVWLDSIHGIALGHRRLSIIDLSVSGSQPMISKCGRFVIVFNGEIYNYKSIKKEIESTVEIEWKGSSDTEVLLAAITLWGIKEAINRCVGMFAVALWDQINKDLYLVRDRLGEKPIYYGFFGDTLLFGSELKSLRQHPDWKGEIDRNSLMLLIRYGYIQAPHSIFKGVFKVTPGTIAKFSGGNCSPEVTVYWSITEAAKNGLANPFQGTEIEAVDSLENLLNESVEIQSLADVPLGAFLSGGVDSSTIAAIMQSQSNVPIKTFTIGFSEEAYNEADHASAVARHLGTEHTSIYVSANDALDVIPSLAKMYDEPFADPSQIPTYLLVKLARGSLKVSLSGDGGDELFAGYSRYSIISKLSKASRFVPLPVRNRIFRMVKYFPPELWERVILFMGSLAPDHIRLHEPGDKIYKLAELFAAKSDYDMYCWIQANWKKNPVINTTVSVSNAIGDIESWKEMPDIYSRMMLLDMQTYLPDDLLVKIDRASMASGLEARLPLLDHRLVEFAWKIPNNLKVRNRDTKWLLKQVLYRHVPESLFDRPKKGFTIPLDEWLRGPLREWAEDLLNFHRIKAEGFFNADIIRQCWQEHLSGVHNWQYALWNVLIFQEWFEEFSKNG
jgi:asparagine synthase (glutamine-hydrolysing)